MKIAIIGLGYVGLPLALQFAESGVQTLGLDIDTDKVACINNARSFIKHVENARIKKCVDSASLEASSDFSRVSETEAVIICVPTPLNKHREPDISFVLESARSIAPHISKNTLVVLESTTYPGTTDTELRNVLEEKSGLQAGVDFHLAFSPEREDPGRTDHSVKTIPKVIGGYSDACLKRCMELYSKAIDQIHPVSSCRVAEAAKLTENIFRSVNIALVNELKTIFYKMDIDIWEVVDAAATKPFGYMPFYPGPGLGGHCIPIDPFYLTWKAREFEQHTRFIELAGEINTSMPNYVIGRVSEALNEEAKPIKNSRILILGLAYKPNVDDCRESPSFVLMKKLEKMGASVNYNDPMVPVIPLTREHSEFANRKSAEISDKYDAILLATHHSTYTTYDFSSFDTPVIDTRNCVQPDHRPTKYYKA